MTSVFSTNLNQTARELGDFLLPSTCEKSIERLKGVIFGNTIFHTLDNKRLEKERVEAKTTPFYTKGIYCFLSSIKYFVLCSLFNQAIKDLIIGSSTDKYINNFHPLIHSVSSILNIISGFRRLIFPLCNQLPKNISDHVITAIAEEVVVRFTFQRALRYLQEGLKEKLPEGYGKDSWFLTPSFRCFTTSFVFGFIHLLTHLSDKRKTSLPQCLFIILFGNAMSIQYETYDSLAYPILSHFLYNFLGETFDKTPYMKEILVSLFFGYAVGLAITSAIPDKEEPSKEISII